MGVGMTATAARTLGDGRRIVVVRTELQAELIERLCEAYEPLGVVELTLATGQPQRKVRRDLEVLARRGLALRVSGRTKAGSLWVAT